MHQVNKLKELAKLIRYYILVSTTAAGSGHPTSSLSAVELMTVLCFGGFFKKGDRLIFSKGHASPLYFSLFTAAGLITEVELLTLRKFGSRLEGHPTMEFPYTEVPTGSLGQGLSAGVGMALEGARTFVLLGDSEMAEGSNWEAMQIASFYKLNNLIAVLDVNRLGQSRETMLGHDIETYAKRVSSFGWETIVLPDGHNLTQIISAYKKALKIKGKPVMLIARTKKGKGVSFFENKESWHGKALPEKEMQEALLELGEIDKKIKVHNSQFIVNRPKYETTNYELPTTNYQLGDQVATRKAYGNALARIFPKFPNIVVMDGETSNSTYSEIFAKKYPEHYFEMFIAEQNMAGVALGMARVGKIPFISTFAAFFSRAFDQIRMAQYSETNVKYCGSHAGVSIGEDGASQMGLEDIAMFRSILGAVILYPSDAVSCEKLVEEAAKHYGIVYIRTTRAATPILYKNNEKFPIGGSKVIHKSAEDKVTVIGAGITLHEALKAYESLQKENINIRVVDLYSIAPIDVKTLQKCAKETQAIVVVEDHHPGGGIGEAVAAALAGSKVYSLAVTKIPRSGKPEELLEYEEINASSIIKKVKKII